MSARLEIVFTAETDSALDPTEVRAVVDKSHAEDTIATAMWTHFASAGGSVLLTRVVNGEQTPAAIGARILEILDAEDSDNPGDAEARLRDLAAALVGGSSRWLPCR